MHKKSGIQNCVTDLNNNFKISDSYHNTDACDNIKIECESCVIKTVQKAAQPLECFLVSHNL